LVKIIKYFRGSYGSVGGVIASLRPQRTINRGLIAGELWWLRRD